MDQSHSENDDLNHRIFHKIVPYFDHMIKVVNTGKYKLIETKDQTKIITLNNKDTFAWVNVKEIGEILVSSHKTHKADTILSVGNYRLYNVKDEPNFSDQLHIELSIGNGMWQGYLLPTGLPNDLKKRNRIIPTSEVITKSKSNCNCEECC